MEVANITDAGLQLAELVDRALSGEEVIITRDGQPVVRLMPLPRETSPRLGGQRRGQVRIAADFDQLPNDLAAAFGVESA